MNTILKAIAAEPVRFVGAVQATLGVGVLLNAWNLSADQIAGMVLAVAAWLSFVTRRAVTPV